MYRFTKKMAYAIEAVLHVAYHGADRPIQAREITRQQSIPERYLEQALQQLVRVGILKGVRGPRGGYRLGRPAERISVGEIAAVIRRMERRGQAGTEEPASELGRKVVIPMLEALDQEIMEQLDRISIADLNAQAADRGLARIEDGIKRTVKLAAAV